MALNITTNITNTLDGYTLDASQVKGGYVSVATLEDRAALPAATVTEGSYCYVAETGRFYVYKDSEWVDTTYNSENVVYDPDGEYDDGTIGKAIQDLEAGKVDKVTGKGLSTNDYTTAEKEKLEGIAEGAEVNVQSDWTQTNTGADDYIKNKPTNLEVTDNKVSAWSETTNNTHYPSEKLVKDSLDNKVDKVSGKGLSTNDYDNTEKSKVANAVQKDGSVAMTGNLNVNSHKITGVSNGTASTDAVNKGQLDAETSAREDAVSDINDKIPDEASSTNQLADKEYVDSAVGEAEGDISDLEDRVDTVESKISSYASSTNKLVSASEMGDAIASVEANQLYATSQQGSFATKAQLTGATTFYNADGTTATPTKNDVVYVLSDETHDGKSAKYVVASISGSTITWGFVITFSDSTFSQTQMDAINSGITEEKREGYDDHVASTDNPHEVTKEQVGLGNVDNTSDATKKSNFTGSIANGNTGFVTGGAVHTALGNKVDKEDGKGLSTNDYTTAEKNKLAGISDDDLGFRYTTGILAVGQTSLSIAVSGTVLNVEVKDSSTGDVVGTEVRTTSTGVTVAIAQAYTHALTVTVLYNAG